MAFSNDKTFQNALNSSFEFFINLNTMSPEYISLFVDDKLRKGLKGVSEEDVEVILDKGKLFQMTLNLPVQLWLLHPYHHLETLMILLPCVIPCLLVQWVSLLA